MTVEISITLFLWLLAIHPFVTYPLSLVVARTFFQTKHYIPQGRISNIRSAAICFSVYNEQDALPQKMANISELTANSALRVHGYAYIDGSTDSSEELLRSTTAPINVYTDKKNRGKSHGLNVLMSQTGEDIVIFTDANVTFSADAIDKLAAYFLDPEVGCVCGSLRYTNPNDSSTAHIGSLYWRLEEKLKQLESDTGNVMGADGSIFAIRRDLFTPIPPATLPDMFISFETLFKGYRIVRAPDACAFERNATDRQDEFRRKIRIACRAFNYHRRFRNELRSMRIWDRYKYFSHKLLRWLSFFWLVAAVGVTSNLLLGFWGALALSFFLLSLVWIGDRCRVPIVSPAASILLAMLATAIGVLESLMGRKYVSWHPATTSR